MRALVPVVDTPSSSLLIVAALFMIDFFDGLLSHNVLQQNYVLIAYLISSIAFFTLLVFLELGVAMLDGRRSRSRLGAAGFSICGLMLPK